MMCKLVGSGTQKGETTLSNFWLKHPYLSQMQFKKELIVMENLGISSQYKNYFGN